MATGDDATRDAALAECVRLLSSESREKKFVGMLLVTRLLPDADDDDTLTRVHDATGFAPFITSMLRAAPTRVPAPAPRDDPRAAEEESAARSQQASASHALALATCAALCRSRDVATHPSMIERLPLFAAAMARKGRYANLPSAAVADACEVTTLIISAGGEPVAAVAADARVPAAAAAAVAAASRLEPSPSPSSSSSAVADPDPDDPDRELPLLGAQRLLALILESPAAYDAVHGPETPRVPVDPDDSRLEDARRASRAVVRSIPALAATLARRPGRPEQIEALRCLCLILSALPARRPGGCLTLELARFARDADGGSGFGFGAWSSDARAGAASVLRAKAPREMRHAALDLAAAVADLVGPRWLCGDTPGDEEASSGDANSNSKPKPKSKPISFFRLASELVRVETAVLLHDLTRDDAAVRAAARASVSVPLVAYERLVGALAADSEAAELAEEAAAKGETRLPDEISLLSAETAQAAVGVLSDVAASLLEFLEHAAENAREEHEKGETRAEGERGREGEHSSGSGPGPGPGPSSSSPSFGSSSPSFGVDPSAVLATTRALGAFLADLPEAHADRVDRLLPALLSSPRAPGSLTLSEASRATVARFLLPYALARTETPAGLDAFAASNAAEAYAALAERQCVHHADDDETRGVVAGVCSAFQNAMDGVERGVAEPTLAVAVDVQFRRVQPVLSRWAARALDVDASASEPPDVDDEERTRRRREDESFLRDLIALDRGVGGWNDGWRDTARALRAVTQTLADERKLEWE